MKIEVVGLLSPGDMGHVVGQVLGTHGMPVLTCLEGRSARTRNLADQAGIGAVDSYPALVEACDLILSILVPAEAATAARKVRRALEGAPKPLVYVDCNAIAPATVRAIGDQFRDTPVRFVDAGIIGPPPRRPGATRFYTSGPDARDFATLGDYGLDVRVIGAEIGQASGLKMTYAALTKGTAALSIALLVAARRMGLDETLEAEFQLSQPERLAAMQGDLLGVPPKAHRWIGEMEEIAQTFEDIGMTPKIHLGAADVYRFLSRSPLAAETPETRDKNRTLSQLIEALADQAKSSG